MATADIALPRRRLLAALRDAHAETTSRAEQLRAAVAGPGPMTQPLRGALTKLLKEAEAQLHRIEITLAHLNERPGGGLVLRSDSLPLFGGTRFREAEVAWAMAEEEREGAQEAARLRELAHRAGQHLAARLMDLTAGERAAAARDLGRLADAGTTGAGFGSQAAVRH
jgi:hypothetical protein